MGTLTLSALNTYTGATLVSSGTLRLGAQPSPSGSLPAGTVLTVSPLGTFDLQDFRQSVASYSGGGTLAMRLQAAQKQTAGAGLPGTPSLTVTGGANMIGTTLNVTLAPQVIKTGDYFTPIKYGSQLGTASQLTVNSPAAIQFTPDYTSNGGYLTLTASLVPFADSALNSNQTAIGNALEPLRANPTGDAVAVIGTLYTLNATELRAALDQIGPVSLGAMSSLGAAEAGVQSTAVSQRMSALA
ncbi:MAG: hypothetical protein NTX64_03020, partial [Elusimicrobia bacterium]|nr:hypothetical protein [Elusimicrobiota bacterium]